MNTVVKKPGSFLQTNELLALVPTEAIRVTVDSGILWVTQEGDSRDHLARAGQTLRFADRKRIVIQALEASCFSIRKEKEFPCPAPLALRMPLPHQTSVPNLAVGRSS